jgi:hypothetical protein
MRSSLENALSRSRKLPYQEDNAARKSESVNRESIMLAPKSRSQSVFGLHFDLFSVHGPPNK